MNALYGVGREKARYAVAIRPWRGLGTILNARIVMRPMTMSIMVTVTSMIVTVMAVFVFRPVGWPFGVLFFIRPSTVTHLITSSHVDIDNL